MNPEDLLWFVGGAVVPAFLVSCLATAMMRSLAPRLGLLDKPNARKVHSVPIPMGGGLGIFLGVTLPFAVGSLLLTVINRSGGTELLQYLPEFVGPHLSGLMLRLSHLWTLLLSGGVLMLLGLWDDRFGLDWRFRLGIQLLIAAFCVTTQGWRLTAFIEIRYWGFMLSTVLSTFWIVALINSFNMLDNMDGLSGGVAAIAAAILAVVLLFSPDPHTNQPQLFVSGFLLVIVGALLGFLWHNRPPARIFMGDAGSYFVGFSIAIATLLATYTSYHSERPYAVLAPLCVMAVPLYDMTTVIYIRLREGRSPFHADKSHFSHRLVELGMSKPKAVLTIYLTTATCGFGALLLHRVDLLGAVVILLIIVCVLTLIAILESAARRKLHDQDARP